jgi:acetyl esterase/lipase
MLLLPTRTSSTNSTWIPRRSLWVSCQCQTDLPQYHQVSSSFVFLCILLGGDSAAGLLIPDTIVYNHLYKHVLPGFPEEFPTPAGYVFSSPVSSTLDDCPSVTENAKKDFNSNRVDWVKIYFQSPNRFEPQPWAFLKTEKLSAHIPKRVLVYVGGHELKRDENILVADTFRNAGADTTMVREEYVHNWFLLKDAVVDEPSVIERAQETFADWLIKTVQQA